MQMVDAAGRYEQPETAGASRYVEQLRVPDLSVGTLSIATGGTDDQTPHTEDEIYVVTAGSATFRAETGERAVGPGDVMYVPAGEDHRFVDVTADLAVLVLFAPAYRSRA
jgi:mannose-6-phosphate isomerase-like protein (cupin superfamily)